MTMKQQDEARGRGAGHSAVSHWLHQRATAVSNFVLMVWLVWSVVQMPGWSHQQFTDWLAMPVNAALMTFALLSVFYHAAMGLQVIIEDYIHQRVFKIVTMIGMKVFIAAAAVICVFSVMKIALAG